MPATTKVDSMDPNINLTDKQARFVEHYIVTLNAAEAAFRAGYSGNRDTLTAMGWQLMRIPRIRTIIKRRVSAAAMEANEVLLRLRQQVDGLPSECYYHDLDEHGNVLVDTLNVDFQKIVELGITHLIKEVRKHKHGYVVKFYDAQAALFKLGQHHELFTNRVKFIDWQDQAIQHIRSGDIEYGALADEFGDSLADELFQRAGVPVEQVESGRS